MAESFDAVLAEMWELSNRTADYGLQGMTGKARLDSIANRLQSAHEAEVAELRDCLDRSGIDARDYRHLSIESAKRADRAVGLLRECEDAVFGKELLERIRAFLSEQAGERENGDG